jgi:hypothetical protein
VYSHSSLKVDPHFEGGFGPMLCLKRDRLIKNQ